MSEDEEAGSSDPRGEGPTSRGEGAADLASHALDHAPVGILVIDADGTIVRANREAERIFRHGRDALVGRPVEALLPEHLRPAHAADRAAFVAAPSARLMGRGRELLGLCGDGTEVPVEIGLRPLQTPDGLRVLASVVDVTERRRAEGALRASEERFRILVEGVRDHALVMLDADGRIESWNDAAARITGHGREEVLGRSFDLLMPPEDRSARAGAALETAARLGRWETDDWCVRADGTRFLASTSIYPLRAGDGSLRGYAEILRDVTARRVLEDQLRQAQRLEAVGTLASGLSHDFNNILLAIVGYAELALEGSPDDGVKRDLARVLEAAERGRTIIHRLLALGRRDLGPRRVTDLERPIAGALDLLRASLPATVALRFHADGEAPGIACDETQVQQVLMNLATNAAQAMGADGGRLEVELAPFHADARAVARHPGLRPGLHARIRVSDTGPGMLPDVAARAFDPFFTTKSAGSGTGLGLWMTREIVHAHGGIVQLRSQAGTGTTVDIYLPAEPPGPAAADAPARPAVAAAGVHVLHVDDEETLAELARRQLEGAGYRVTVRTSSLRALEEFRASPQRFDLVITDNTMPHLTGARLAEELVRIRPDLPILMVSGHGGDGTGGAVPPPGVRRVLPKPYGAAALLAAVRAVLAEG